MADTEFRLTIEEIIEEALDENQVAADGESMTSNLFQGGRNMLNRVLEEIGAYSLNLWLEEEGTLFVNKGQGEYKTDESVLANDYVETQLSASYVATDTIIIVDDPQAIAVDDFIRVILDDKTAHDTTVFAIAGDMVTLTDGFPSDATLGNFVYSFTVADFLPIAVIQDHTTRYVQHRGQQGRNYEIQMNSWNRKEFNALPFKNQEGTPTLSFYQREDSAAREGTLFIWTSPDTSDLRIQFSYYRKIQVFLETEGDLFLDAPDYFQEAIIMALAYKLSGPLGTKPRLVAELKERSDEAMNMALGYNTTVSGRAIQIMGGSRA